MADEVVVFSSLNLADVYLVRSMLTREGIASRLRGGLRGPLGGEIPIDDARAELVVERASASAAEALIRAAREADTPDRICPSCGETNPGSFEICWQCGAELVD